MNQENVDPIDSESLEAVLKGAHYAVVAVVEDSLKLEAAKPLVLDGVGTERPPQYAANLGRDDVVIARLAVERAAERMLSEPTSIPWGRIEIVPAAVPGGADDRRRLVVLDLVEELARRRGAKTELGDADVRPAKVARLQGREISDAHVRDFPRGPTRERVIPQARCRNAADSPSPPPLRWRAPPWSRRCPARTPPRRTRPCDARSSSR